MNLTGSKHRFTKHLGIVCLLLLLVSGLEAQFYAKKYAIVIGVNQYPHGNLPNLSYAKKDAQGVAELMEKLGFTVYTRYDKQATKRNIISLLEDQLAPRLSKKDAVLFFFAGHGTTRQLGGKDWGYIVPYDATEQSSSFISMDEIRTLSLKMGNAKHQAFIMDCCYGGQLALRNVSNIPSNIPNYLDQVSERVARQILTAGGKNQVVADGGPYGHSVFTGYFIKGIREGLADLNADGWITFGEMVTYIQPAANRPNQTPGYATLPGHEQGELLLRALKPMQIVGKTPIITEPSPDPGRRDLFGTTLDLPRAAQLGIEFVSVQGGTFQMGDQWGDGSDDEKPVHQVTLSDFEMSKHEVTNQQFCAFLNERGNQEEGGATWLAIKDEDCLIEQTGNRFTPKSGYKNHPVIEVNWYGAKAFAAWLGSRLPTEAEWEYAARAGGRKKKYPYGDQLTHDDANFTGTGGKDQWDRTAPVGSFLTNDLGLFDMAGNVWEWCQDWHGAYSSDSQTDPTGPRSGGARVLRGGSWYHGAWNCRTVIRNWYTPDDTDIVVGFRVVRSAQ